MVNFFGTPCSLIAQTSPTRNMDLDQNIETCFVLQVRGGSDSEDSEEDDEVIMEALRQDEERQKQKKLFEHERLEQRKRLGEEVENILKQSDESDDDVIYVARVPVKAKILTISGDPVEVLTNDHIPARPRPYNITLMPRKAMLSEMDSRENGSDSDGDKEDDNDSHRADKDFEDDAEVVTLDSDTDEGHDSPLPVCTISDVFSGPSFVQYPDWDSAPSNPSSETGEQDTKDRDVTSDEDDDIQIVEEVTSSSKRERTLQEILGELSK